MVHPSRGVSRRRLSSRSLSRVLTVPLPAPPDALRRGPFRRRAFPSRLRSPRLTAQLGLALGIAFSISFLTGLLSHLIQHPPDWFAWPSRPVWLYRVTQGLHVATGLAIIPILAAKLWSVYPKLFTWPPLRDIGHALARGSIVVLGAAALFQLVTGLLNIAYWYTPMPFAFIASHYWVAWLVIGSILLHVALKLPIIRGALSRQRPLAAPAVDGDVPILTRRGLLAAVAGAVGVVTLATVGQTVRPLKGVSVLAPRRPDVGPQGLPVNTSAQAAGVLDVLSDPAYRLVLNGPAGETMFTLDQLATMPQSTVDLPITCVEGWSADGTWTGVRIRELVALAGGDPDHASVLVQSLQQGSPYSTSILDASHTADPLSILALRLNGGPLDRDHGYPARLIAPNRPGVMQTKWVTGVRVIAP